MINSLFSSFDPLSSTLNTNYIVIVILLTTPIFLKLNRLNNRLSSTIARAIKIIEEELKSSIINNNNLGKIKILIAVFFILILFNLIGLIPYVFTITAQLIFTLRLSLPF
jgi:hypothetical protein